MSRRSTFFCGIVWFHWHKTQKELVRSRETLHVQEERLRVVRNKQAEADQLLGSLRTRLQELRNRLSELHTESATLHNQREQVSRDLAVLDERQRSSSTQQQNLQNDLARMEESEKAFEERHEALQDETDHLETELAEAQSGLASNQKALDDRLAQRRQLEQELRDLRRRAVSLETRLVELKAHQNELLARQTESQSALENIQRQVQASTLEVDASAKRKEEAAAAVLQAEKALHEAEQALSERQARVQSLQDALRKQQDELNAAVTRKTRFASQYEVLAQAEETMTGLANGAQTVIQASRQGKLKGAYRLLSTSLDVPQELEIAIAAVLGDQLESIVLDTGAEADQALDLLASSEKGRAVLFTHEIQAYKNPKTQSFQEDGIIGYAADLVKADSSLQNAVKYLLGQVLVVKDRHAARSLLPNLAPSARLVTLQGEVFSPQGMVIGGRETRSRVIGRPRQKRELEENIAAVDELIQSLEKGVREAGDSLKKEQESIHLLQEKVSAARNEQRSQSQRHQKCVLEAEQVRQKTTLLTEQQTRIQESMERANEELANGRKEIEEIGSRIQAQQQKVTESSQALHNLSVDELQREVVHWQTVQAVNARALSDAKRRLGENEQLLVSNRSQRQGIQKRLQTLQTDETSIASQIDSLHGQETNINEALAALQTKIEPAETELTHLERDYNTRQDNQTAASQAVTVAERYYTQAQVENSRCRDSLENLRKKIDDDFGLVSLEYTEEMSGPKPLPLDGVKELPMLTEIPSDLEDNISRQRTLLRRMGAINPEAQKEYDEVKERFDFLTEQVADLRKADADLRLVIQDLDELMRKEFRQTFNAVASEFKGMFTRLFGGGAARLVLQDEENPTETGIDIEARLPGRREQGLSLLSGGERSLTAVALIFSLLKVSPTPFCVLDEVDAMLDEANVGRFCELLKELSETTQFIVITHNRNTVQTADVIYGITMGRDSASQVISLRLDEVSEEMVR